MRRVARVCPIGLTTSVDVSELLPQLSDNPELTDDHVARYEAALDAFEDRDWTRAVELLHQVPAADLVKKFLTGFIAQHNRTPPADWDGVIRL